MTEKYNNKYRISSTRVQKWNYGWDASYFITICTQSRKCYFGDIVDIGMELSPVGILADLFWREIINHTKYVELGPFVVMPNHVHGVLILNGNNANNVKTRHALSQRSQQALSLQQQQTIGQQRFQNQGGNTISSIIGSYKSAVTKSAHHLGFDFAWQSRFYDHIIRDEKSYNKIENYIIENPSKWNKNNFNPP